VAYPWSARQLGDVGYFESAVMTDKPPKFTPVFGRPTRQFDRMWQSVQYATGYDAHTMGTAQDRAFTNPWYEMGRKDAIEDKLLADIALHMAQVKVQIKAETFDQMIDGVMQ
jgi:hypothetical protein